MNKIELKEYLLNHFEIVLTNQKNTIAINHNKNILNIKPGSKDDKCYPWVCEYVAMNKKGEKFYFIYYGKKNTKLVWDDNKKNISLRLENGVTKRYNYDSLLKQIKKELTKSSSYIVFFSVDEVIFEPSTNNHIFVLNEHNIENFLNSFFDF